MKHLVTLLTVLSLMPLVGCERGTTAPSQVATATATADRLLGKSLADLDESGEYLIKKLGKVYRESPIEADAGRRRHYKVERYTAKSDGAVFKIYYSYLDEEDGGNTYGWIEDGKMNVLARIADGDIEAVDDGSDDDSFTHALPNTPRPLTPAVSLQDIAALNGLLTKLVEEFEGKVVNPHGNGDDHLDVDVTTNINPCRVSEDHGKSTCEITYLQDRWNGTLKATLKVENGQAVELSKALFSGNY